MKSLKKITFILLIILTLPSVGYSQDSSAIKAEPKINFLKIKHKEKKFKDKLILSFGTGMFKTSDKDSANFNLGFQAGIGYWSESVIVPVFLNASYRKELISKNYLEQFDIYVSAFAPLAALKSNLLYLTGGFGLGVSIGKYRKEEGNIIKTDSYICPQLIANGGLMFEINEQNTISINGFYQLKKYRSLTGAELNYILWLDL